MIEHYINFWVGWGLIIVISNTLKSLALLNSTVIEVGRDTRIWHMQMKEEAKLQNM